MEGWRSIPEMRIDDRDVGVAREGRLTRETAHRDGGEGVLIHAPIHRLFPPLLPRGVLAGAPGRGGGGGGGPVRPRGRGGGGRGGPPRPEGRARPGPRRRGRRPPAPGDGPLPSAPGAPSGAGSRDRCRPRSAWRGNTCPRSRPRRRWGWCWEGGGG